MASFIKSKHFARSFAQIEHTLLGIRSTIIHAHNDRSTSLYAHNLELRPEWKRSMRTSHGIAVKNFTACSFLAIKPLTVITCISRKGIAYFSLFLNTRRFRNAGITLAMCRPRASRTSQQDTENYNQQKTGTHRPTQSRTCCCTYFREFRLPC